MAAVGDSAYEGEFREIVYRHVEMIKEVIPAGEKQVSLQRQIGELLNELKDIFQGFYLIKEPFNHPRPGYIYVQFLCSTRTL